MELFSSSGHLTDEALLALIQGRELPELARLEMAEHLAYCDQCLQRYTMLLTDDALLSPAQPCQAALWRRIRERTLRLLASRYTTAAAAVALALTVLWGSSPTLPFKDQLSLPKTPSAITERWNESLSDALSRFHAVFDYFDGTTRTT